MATKPMYSSAMAAPAPAMADNAMMADDAMMAAEEEVAPEGYVIEIMVKGDGTFEVAKADLKMEAEEMVAEDTMSYDSLGQAMKAVIDLVKNNPISASEQSQFDAGFEANAA